MVMSVLPELGRTIDELIRRDLQNLSDSSFRWLLISSGVVAVGVMLGGPEIVQEVRAVLRPAPNSKHQTPSYISLLALLGWILVIAGLVGEGIAEALVFKIDGLVQTFNEISLSEAEKQSGRATERASIALLEQERLRSENLRLEALIQPRSLSLDQQRAIGLALRPFKGRKLVIAVASLNDPESYDFGQQLLASVNAAKVDLMFSAGSASGKQYGAITETGIQIRWPQGQHDLAMALERVLRGIGQARKVSVVQGSPTVSGSTEFLKEAVEILVFPKPFNVLR